MPGVAVPPDVPELPASATAHVTERHPSGAEREVAYLLEGEVVAVRLLAEDGRVELHSPRRAGVRHGIELYWDDGRLRSAIPYADGLEHGEAVQWDAAGEEIGRYAMRAGTGLDLWRARRADGSVYLVEVRYLVSGERHGPEWLVAEDQTSVRRESRYAAGTEHGIFRAWDDDDRLVGGHPLFYLLGRVVPAEEYAAATVIDPDLPVYRPADDLPSRVFPALVRPHLRPLP